jgi:peptidoglycan hydrolase CwlO-like protein
MSRFRKQLVILVVGAVIALVAIPVNGQTSEELEVIREERRELQDELAVKAASVDASEAELDDLAAAVEVLTANVTAQELRVADSQRTLTNTRARLVQAHENVASMEAELTDRQTKLASRAVASWLNQGSEPPLLVESDDPTQASRMQALVGNVSGTEADMADELRELKDDLQVEREIAADANIDANTIAARLKIELTGLEQAKAQAQDLANAAEARLEHLLLEQQYLETLDEELAEEYDIALEELKEILKRTATEDGGPTAPLPDRSEVVKVGTIWVHASIAPELELLLAHAEGDGISLKGGGYRDSARQVQLRIAHCGGSDYAIWDMPPSQCSPPTARPGRSLHERGLAIDFTDNGRAINSRSSKAYKWLKANAADYGLFNLPSEPWHWSTTGG